MSRESERLYDGVTQIEDDVVEAAQRPKRRRRALWMAPVAVVLALAILAGVLNGRGGLRAYAVAEAVYPEPKDRRGGNWDTFSQQAVTGFAAVSLSRRRAPPRSRNTRSFSPGRTISSPSSISVLS